MDFIFGLSIAVNLLSIYACFTAMRRLRELDRITLFEKALTELKDRQDDVETDNALWYDKFKHLAARIEHRKRKLDASTNSPQDGTGPQDQTFPEGAPGPLSPKEQRLLIMRRYRATHSG